MSTIVGVRCFVVASKFEMLSGAAEVGSFNRRERQRGRVIAEWMLDTAACFALVLGEPRLSVAALCNLHQLLIDQHFAGKLAGRFHDRPRKAQCTSHQTSFRRTRSRCDKHMAPDEHDVRPGRASGNKPSAAFKRRQTPCEPVSTRRQRRASKGA